MTVTGTTTKKMKGPKFLVVIDQEIRELLKIKDGDFVKLSVEKILPKNEEAYCL